MLNGDQLMAKVPLRRKKTFNSGVFTPHNLRYCSDCSKDVLCDRCDKLVSQKNSQLFLVRSWKKVICKYF